MLIPIHDFSRLPLLTKQKESFMVMKRDEQGSFGHQLAFSVWADICLSRAASRAFLVKSDSRSESRPTGLQ
jgi:hypothetical protein